MLLDGVPSFLFAVGGFFLGYVVRPVISTEYTKYRERQIESQKARERWETEVRELLSELEHFCRGLQMDSHPDVESVLEDLNSFEERLYKQSELSPDVGEEVNAKLEELAGFCAAHQIIVSDLVYRLTDYDGGRIELPHSSEYDNIYIDEEEGLIDPKRVIKETYSSLGDKTIEQSKEIKSMLDDE